MTRAEAIKQLKTDVTDCCATMSNQWEKDEEALDMAINSLKIDEMYDLEKENADEFISKSVLEDIKAEVENYEDFSAYDRQIARVIWCFFDKHISGKEQE